MVSVLACCPIADVGLLRHAGGHYLGMGCRHALRHGAAHAPERLGRSRLGQALGGPLNICARYRAVGAAGLYEIEIDIELARQRSHRRQNLKRLCMDRLARCTRRFPSALSPIQLADNRARIGLWPFGKFDERRSHFHQIALGTEQPSDAAAARRWYLYDRLVRLDRHEWLVGNHMIALGDVPRDDFGLLEAFAEIGQQELAHSEPPMQFRQTGIPGARRRRCGRSRAYSAARDAAAELRCHSR